MAFALKRVSFEGRAQDIVCQSDNGPCPLLAIVNILLLERRAALEPATIERQFVTIEELVQLVAEVLLTASGVSTTSSEGHQVQVNSVLELLPSLSRGLDLNIFFNTCTGFEYTSALDVFDSLGIGLVHGWLVDPQMVEVVQAMQGLSYNQLAFELAAARAEHPTPPTAAAAAAAAQAPPPPSPAAPSPRLQRAHVLEEFLRDSASQLTYYGLAQLYAALEKGRLSVLFRNNHFAVCLRREARLFLLVTDAGFVDNEDIVWEGLDVSDSAFYDSHFRPTGDGCSSSSSSSSSSSISSSSRVAVRDINFDSVLRPGHAARDDGLDASERLARQLEREDADRALAQRLQHQHQQHQHQQHQLHQHQQHQPPQPHNHYQQQQYRQYAQRNQQWGHLSYQDWRAMQPQPKPADSSGGCVAQ